MASKKRLPTMVAADWGRVRDTEDAMDTPLNWGKRSRTDDPHLARAPEKGVGEHAKWRAPGVKSHWNVVNASPLEGRDTAIPAWPVDQ